jgi:hypothetical protein
MGILVIEHLIVKRIEVLLYMLQLLKDMLIPNRVSGIIVLGHKDKSPLLLIVPNGDLEVTPVLPLIPHMDCGAEPQGIVI